MVEMSAIRVSHFNRERTFVSTLPYMKTARFVAKRDSPWANGWSRKSDAPMPTMMRMRTRHAQGEAVRYSSYQYHPTWLLYREDTWAGTQLAGIARAVRGNCPDTCRAVGT